MFLSCCCLFWQLYFVTSLFWIIYLYQVVYRVVPLLYLFFFCITFLIVSIDIWKYHCQPLIFSTSWLLLLLLLWLELLIMGDISRNWSVLACLLYSEVHKEDQKKKSLSCTLCLFRLYCRGVLIPLLCVILLFCFIFPFRYYIWTFHEGKLLKVHYGDFPVCPFWQISLTESHIVCLGLIPVQTVGGG